MSSTIQSKTEEQQIKEYQEWRSSCKARGYFWEVERTDIINFFIEKNKYINYLEIGVCDGDNIRRVKAEHIDGVDPGVEGHMVPETNYPVTSDDFFKMIKDEDIKYDIIFIDGLHYDYQVYKDVKNALKHIQPNGTIVCHDMNPKWEVCQRKQVPAEIGAWNGDCWKAWIKLRTELSDYTMSVVNTDHGVGVIQKGKQELLELTENPYDLDYSYLENNRKKALNLISTEDFYKIYD